VRDAVLDIALEKTPQHTPRAIVGNRKLRRSFQMVGSWRFWTRVVVGHRARSSCNDKSMEQSARSACGNLLHSSQSPAEGVPSEGRPLHFALPLFVSSPDSHRLYLLNGHLRIRLRSTTVRGVRFHAARTNAWPRRPAVLAVHVPPWPDFHFAPRCAVQFLPALRCEGRPH